MTEMDVREEAPPALLAGPPVRDDRGSVTVEAAIALVAMLAVMAGLVWGLALVGAQLALGEASRAAARVAARGESQAAVVAEAHRLLPDAVVAVLPSTDGHVEVEVARTVSPPGLLARLGPVHLTSRSTAALEAGASA